MIAWEALEVVRHPNGAIVLPRLDEHGNDASLLLARIVYAEPATAERMRVLVQHRLDRERGRVDRLEGEARAFTRSIGGGGYMRLVDVGEVRDLLHDVAGELDAEVEHWKGLAKNYRARAARLTDERNEAENELDRILARIFERNGNHNHDGTRTGCGQCTLVRELRLLPIGGSSEAERYDRLVPCYCERGNADDCPRHGRSHVAACARREVLREPK